MKGPSYLIDKITVLLSPLRSMLWIAKGLFHGFLCKIGLYLGLRLCRPQNQLCAEKQSASCLIFSLSLSPLIPNLPDLSTTLQNICGSLHCHYLFLIPSPVDLTFFHSHLPLPIYCFFPRYSLATHRSCMPENKVRCLQIFSFLFVSTDPLVSLPSLQQTLYHSLPCILATIYC